SSRRRHTRCLSDWSSDVCSSDLKMVYVRNITLRILMKQLKKIEMVILFTVGVIMVVLLKLEMPFDWITDGLCHIMLIWLRNTMRSEERRVGKECKNRW